MRILITGAAGFIGQLVAKALLDDPSHTLILTDVVEPPIPPGAAHPQNATAVKADLCSSLSSSSSSSSAATIVPPGGGLDAVFVLHGIMSSGSEANFDLGMRVNVDATRALLEDLRRACPGVRVIYASSLAVYGAPLPEVVRDDAAVPARPMSSYGAQKVVCETLINEYSRRGFVDGLSLRFPTVSVRPGRPAAAASSFLSGMVREPLAGLECVVPVEDRAFKAWLCSPRTLVVNLLHALHLDTGRLPGHVRQVNLPGICVTVQEMRDALEKVGGREKLSLLKEKTDPELLPILKSWPTCFDTSQAFSLGFQRDQSFEQTVRDYKDSL